MVRQKHADVIVFTTINDKGLTRESLQCWELSSSSDSQPMSSFESNDLPGLSHLQELMTNANRRIKVFFRSTAIENNKQKIE